MRLSCTALFIAAIVGAQPRQGDVQTREAAYRANNLGVALLEQFNYGGAADAFRGALQLDPSLALARLNLGIALLYVPDLDGADRAAAEAARLLPGDPRPQYVRGLIARARGDEAQARAAFEGVSRIDPHDVGTQVNLGQVDLQQQRYADAIERFRAALADEPANVTATYGLGLALTRAGRRDEGRQALERSQALRTGGAGIVFSASYLEQGRYAEAVASTGAERALADRAVPDVTFTRTATDSGAGDAPGLGITVVDFDNDGHPDVLVVWPQGLRLLRNDRGAFVDVTAGSGLPTGETGAVGAVAGDYDNDGRPDILVLRTGGSLLYHNDGGGRFSNATASAQLPPYPSLPASAAFVDIDHDGDLDLVIAGDGPVQVLRNNGNGTFTDITAQSGVTGASRAIAVVPTDYDNHRDIDLLVVRRDEPPMLFKNLRDGTFRDAAADAGLRVDGRFTSVAAADVNKDDFPDFFFGRADAPGLFALSDGRGRFTIVPAPARSAGATAAQFLDYDNDGLLDLLTWSPQGPRLFRNVGDDWIDVTSRAFSPAGDSHPATIASARALASADVNGDGGLDLLVGGGSGGLDVWRHGGTTRNRSVRVTLAGRASNRAGVGSKIDLRAGSLRQRLETSAATPAVAPANVLFGLGPRQGADVVRVVWPSGIVQAETPVPSSMAIQELNRKPSSCPFLYAWNGQQFEFVTDFLGGGEMGYWEAPGIRHSPDPDEYVRIRGDQLRPTDGRYELRITNELEEALFLDRLQLIAVTHPADIDVFPNEGMADPPKPFRLYAVRDLRPPARALDDHGHDVTARVARLDRQYPDDFAVLPFRGYAETHTLTLTLASAAGPRLLLLTGWTDYAFSSDNVAAYQAGLTLQPPRLDVKDARGRWVTAIADIGVPVGRPQTIVVDLGTRNATEVRIVTNMRVYWDQILVGTPAPHDAVRVDRLDPVRARLRWRGFSAEKTGDGRLPAVYDYDRVSTEPRWKIMPGRYTREGDVRPLLLHVDDRFVVSRPGDEIAVSFDASRLPPPASGSTRTFLLFADGFSKEMDINSASPDRLMPLPFHGMTRYPYSPPEQYPDTPALRRYQSQYNTRIVAGPLPSLDDPAVRPESVRR